MVLKEKSKSHAIENAWNQLKRELHYTNKQMWKQFPDLAQALINEQDLNDCIDIGNLYKTHLFKRYGYRK